VASHWVEAPYVVVPAALAYRKYASTSERFEESGKHNVTISPDFEYAWGGTSALACQKHASTSERVTRADHGRCKLQGKWCSHYQIHSLPTPAQLQSKSRNRRPLRPGLQTSYRDLGILSSSFSLPMEPYPLLTPLLQFDSFSLGRVLPIPRH